MRPKLVLFGDSITESSFVHGGWGSALANHFARTADVILRGYSGYNTRWALAAADKVFDGMPPADVPGTVAAVTVFFGANDATLPDRSSAPQHVPVEEYKNNLRGIVRFIKERWPAAVVVLITPPPIDEDGRRRFPYGDNSSGLPERTNESAGTYAKACISVAAQYGWPVVDLHSKMQQIPGWEKALLSDGLHLTPEGNKVVFEEVLATLENNGIGLDSFPIDLPSFQELYKSSPSPSS